MGGVCLDAEPEATISTNSANVEGGNVEGGTIDGGNGESGTAVTKKKKKKKNKGMSTSCQLYHAIYILLIVSSCLIWSVQLKPLVSTRLSSTTTQLLPLNTSNVLPTGN